MARRRIAAGELGDIQVTRLANGSWRARARTRDDAGELHQLRAVAGTEEEARAEITRRATALRSSGYIGLTASDTVADACAAWLAQVRVRAQAGALSFSTYESYEQTARLRMAAAAVRRRLALADRGAEALLFPTATGSPMSVSN